MERQIKQMKLRTTSQSAIDRWEVGLTAKGLAEVYQIHDGLGYSQINWDRDYAFDAASLSGASAAIL